MTEDFLGMDMNRWNVTSGSNATFILLPANINPESVINGFDSFKKKHLRERDVEINDYSLVPLTDLHNNTLYNYLTYTTSNETIFIFGIIGLVILIIAGINFINLSVAQAVKRFREVGVRKALGAHRSQLISQHIGESLQYNFIAIILAVILVLTFLPELNNFLSNGTNLKLFGNIYVPIFLLSVFIVFGLITGVYPALILSRFNPAKMFRTDFSNTKRGFFSLRNSLVGIQFIISQVLIISVFVIAAQLKMIKNKELGFARDSIVNVQLPEPDRSKMDVLRNKLLSNTNIKNVSFQLGPPTSNAILQSYVQFEASDELKNEVVKVQLVDENFINLFDIKLLAGTQFSRYFEGDTLYKYIVNESMMKKMNVINPVDAIGKTISVSRYRGEIIGVVNDFHQLSLHDKITPLIMTNFITDLFGNTSVKISSDNIPAQIDYIKSSFAEIFPGYIYDVEFYDEFLGQLYEAEERIFTIIQSFAILAIIIGCLGLFGLMSFIAVQKTKEIGIRKVLGASVTNILSNLSKQFSKVIVISNIIAWPVAWYIMNQWLQDFAYRIEISIWIFILSGLIALIIATLTISYQAIKAAYANPVNALKYE
jgi:ABC-type antimicrobial peptide transport system permease subunit